MNTYRDEQGRWITADPYGVEYVSDEAGAALIDEDGFVTFVNVVLG